MKMAILLLSAALLVGSAALPAQAQRAHGGWGGGFGRVNHWEMERGWGFDRWGYGYGPYRYWGFYGYPYAAYAYYYYPPTMYYVPPTYSTMTVPVVTYYPVPVAVPVATPAPPTTYSGNVGTPGVPPSGTFSTNTAARPIYPGFVPQPSTSNSEYYPDPPAPDR